MRSCLALLLALAPLASGPGCAGGPQRPALYDPGDVTPAQQERLRQAEKAYRTGDPGYAALRDELAADPVTAFWLARMFVRDVLWAIEHREVGEQQLIQAATGARHPVEVRAREQIAALGAAAVPCLIEDLLKNRHADRRELGVDLLGEVGEPAIEPVLALVQDPELRHRRAGIRALLALPATPRTLSVLEEALADPEFTVRADAVRALARGGPAQAARLRQVLAQDDDPFVRRVAAETLVRFGDPETARALVDYLARCLTERDAEGAEAAQEALQRLARSGPRTLEAWRQWLQERDSSPDKASKDG